MLVLATTLGDTRTEKNLKLKEVKNFMRNKATISDVDNTLLDLLGGLEKRIKGYSKSMQETYSFDTKIINKVAEPKDIYSLFSEKGFFTSLEPTKLLTMVNSRNRFKGNFVIMTHETNVDAFLEKVNRLSALMPEFRGTTIFMYGTVYRNEKLASRDFILNLVRKEEMFLMEDHPDALKYAYNHNIRTFVLDHSYVVKEIEFLKQKYPNKATNNPIKVIKQEC